MLEQILNTIDINDVQKTTISFDNYLEYLERILNREDDALVEFEEKVVLPDKEKRVINYVNMLFRENQFDLDYRDEVVEVLMNENEIDLFGTIVKNTSSQLCELVIGEDIVVNGELDLSNLQLPINFLMVRINDKDNTFNTTTSGSMSFRFYNGYSTGFNNIIKFVK